MLSTVVVVRLMPDASCWELLSLLKFFSDIWSLLLFFCYDIFSFEISRFYLLSVRFEGNRVAYPAAPLNSNYDVFDDMFLLVHAWVLYPPKRRLLDDDASEYKLLLWFLIAACVGFNLSILKSEFMSYADEVLANSNSSLFFLLWQPGTFPIWWSGWALTLVTLGAAKLLTTPDISTHAWRFTKLKLRWLMCQFWWFISFKFCFDVKTYLFSLLPPLKDYKLTHWFKLPSLNPSGMFSIFSLFNLWPFLLFICLYSYSNFVFYYIFINFFNFELFIFNLKTLFNQITLILWKR